MELSFCVQFLIIFALLGINGQSTVLNKCEEFNEKFCKCSDKDSVEGTPLKMCSYKDGKDVYCKPCQDVVLENATCTQCPELTCITCNINSVELTSKETKSRDNATCADCLQLKCPPCNLNSVGRTNEQTIGSQDNATCTECQERTCPQCNISSIEMRNEQTIESTIKSEHSHQNSSSIRQFCPISENLYNLGFVCHISKDKKECELACSKENIGRNKNSYHFSCNRSENVWKTETKPCVETLSKNERSNATCADCLELKCTACNLSSFGLTNQQTIVFQDNATCTECLEVACSACNFSVGPTNEHTFRVQDNATCNECQELTCPECLEIACSTCSFRNFLGGLTNEQTIGVQDNATCSECQESLCSQCNLSSIDMRNDQLIGSQENAPCMECQELTCSECLEIACSACSFHNFSVGLRNEQTIGVQDNATCTECQELSCPQCNISSIEMRNEQTRVSENRGSPVKKTNKGAITSFSVSEPSRRVNIDREEDSTQSSKKNSHNSHGILNRNLVDLLREDFEWPRPPVFKKFLNGTSFYKFPLSIIEM